jgi:hypothetical protein
LVQEEDLVQVQPQDKILLYKLHLEVLKPQAEAVVTEVKLVQENQEVLVVLIITLETQEDILHLKEITEEALLVGAAVLVQQVLVHQDLEVQEHLMQILKEMETLPMQVVVDQAVILVTQEDQEDPAAEVMVVIDQAVQVTQDKVQQDQAAEAAALTAEDQEAEEDLEECSSEYLQITQ